MHWENRFFEHAAYQEGLVAKFQLPLIGCSSKHWTRAKQNGRWTELSERLLASRCSVDTPRRRALAAVLDASPGAFLHARSALAWVGMPGYSRWLGELLVARPRSLSGARSTLAHVHELRSVRAHDVLMFDGVPCESPLRAIWTEAARYARPGLEDIGAKKIGNLLDAAHRRDLVTWADLHETVDDIQQRGRAGTRLMRALAEARPPGSSPTESNLETRLEELLERAGAEPLERQRRVGGHDLIGRVDHVDANLPLVVETNSLRFHTTPSDQLADECRYRRLTAAGFTVGVIWEDDLWANPRGAVDTVAAARKRARNGAPVVVHSPACPWPAPWTGQQIV